MTDPPESAAFMSLDVCSGCQDMLDGLCQRAQTLEALSISIRGLIQRNEFNALLPLLGQFQAMRDQIVADVSRLGQHRLQHHNTPAQSSEQSHL
jgi:hypothetical protein